MMPTMRVAVAIVIAAAPAARSQSLASRVALVRDGTVHMTFAARPGVCGDGRGNVWTNFRGNNIRWSERTDPCIAGPVVVRIGRADNQTVSVRTTVGGVSRAAGADADLGDVSAPEAARYLLSIAHTISGRSADDALSGAIFADGIDIAPELNRLVRDDRAPLSSRRQALFWLGQSDAPTRDLANLYGTLEAFPLREQYTFVLSQRHDDEALDLLIDVARRDRDMEIRKRALFWLGQSKDPKAKKFLRDLLTR